MRWIIGIAMLAVVGCASNPPQTIDQTLVYAEAQVTALAETAVEMRHAMTDEQYAEVVRKLEQANDALDTAWDATEHDREKVAHENVQAALDVIASLRNELDRRQDE